MTQLDSVVILCIGSVALFAFGAIMVFEQAYKNYKKSNRSNKR